MTVAPKPIVQMTENSFFLGKVSGRNISLADVKRKLKWEGVEM